MNSRTPQRRLMASITLAAWTWLAITAATTHAQVIADPGVIQGTFTFTNTNPDILAVWSSQGEHMSALVIEAFSVDLTPPLSASTTGAIISPTSAEYELTVDAGPAGAGIRYLTRPLLLFDGNVESYRHPGVISDPVEAASSGGAPEILDFTECAGLLQIRFVDENGSPALVDSGGISAISLSEGGSEQARGSIFPPGIAEEYLTVRGDALYNVTVSYTRGTDPFSNTLSLSELVEDVDVPCDEIVPITIVIPSGGEDGELGTISGVLDMLGKDEHLRDGHTLISARFGPFNNSRFDTIDAAPSSGVFELENLVPSDANNPPLGYRIDSSFFFGLGNRFQKFTTPVLEGVNGRVSVEAGQTTDLGDTFVMDPGFTQGEIFLQGPPADPFGACLEDPRRDSDLDLDGDGLPDFILPWTFGFVGTSQVYTFGSPTFATGATQSTFGALAQGLFEGEFDLASEAFQGNYELAVGGLNREAGIWGQHGLGLFLYDVATPEDPESYQFSDLRIVKQDVGEVEIAPGEFVEIPHRYCFAQVNLGFRSTSGIFFGPRLAGTGGFVGTDFENNPAEYTVTIQEAHGTPNNLTDAAGEGQVTLCLPEGNFLLRPTVNSVGSGGSTSTTQLPPVSIDACCGCVLNVTPELQITADPIACTPSAEVEISGAVQSSDGVEVERISASLNSGPNEDVCTDCGEDPIFVANLSPLAACDNTIAITATDSFGLEASVTTSTRFDGTEPQLNGCQDIDVEIEADQSGAFVDFAVSSTDNCDQSPVVSCDPPANSFYPEGTTQVTCATEDSCGNIDECTFSISVSSCQAVEPEVKTQGFWKRQCRGPHPSGEHSNLPGYVSSVNQVSNFADISNVGDLCNRLTPKPKKNKCEQAEAQFMALLLNRASERVTDCNCLEDPDTSSTNLGEAIDHIDSLLSNTGRSFHDCVEAQAIADRINNGVTLVSCPD